MNDVADFLDDRESFLDCAADYMLYPGANRREWDDAANDLRQLLATAFSLKDTDTYDYDEACVAVCERIFSNIEESM